MIPVVTPAEMAAIDAAAPEPVEVLVDRAGAAVAWAARRLLGGTYGRRIVVVAGPGNNGADGIVAARRLARWGARVEVRAPVPPPVLAPDADLVIDAAFGTGLGRPYEPPDPGAVPVLAVDIPSGIDGLTGGVRGGALTAVRTVTFAAWKPGLLFGEGPDRAGTVEVADIGLDCSRASAWVVDAAAVAAWVRPRPAGAHKWRSAVWVIGGSPGMTGAPSLAAGAAARAGAGYVRLSVPGGAPGGGPVEVVGTPLRRIGWDLSDLGRFGALVVGPGLGRSPGMAAEVRRVLATADIPVVIDGDALHATDRLARRAPTILTPHDGEFTSMTGHAPGDDRMAAARALAADRGATVLLKGPTTVVADPDGAAYVMADGDERLATAGTGDVLAGICGALLATGLDPTPAAAAAAWLHAHAARRAPRHGMVATDVLTHLPGVLGDVFDR